MRLPLTWLKEFVPKLPPTPKLAELLAMHGLEVEDIITNGHQFNHVVIGQIVEISAHPDADKLRVAQVLVRPQGPPLTIVCGAPNIEVGQKVAVALVGAKLPNGLTIAKRAIRGVESNGMICAADELGLGDDHRGIMVLDADLKIGRPFADAVGLHQEVLDITTPANRADLMSVRGLAWEIAAINGTHAKFAPTKLVEGEHKNTISVTVDDSDNCPLYTARRLRGLQVEPSSLPLQNTMHAIGMRPINNIVDTTNFIMWKYGQPLHAFDAAKITGSIAVRRAKAGETLVTLDGQTRQLDPSMIVIADASGPIALAGVMGGQATEVTSATTEVILEAAIFNPVAIRTTSRKLGLVSEASKRFEKGLWPSLAISANDAAAAMLVELYGGTVDRRMVKVGLAKHVAQTVTMDPAYITQRLGQTVPTAKSKTLLTRLGFDVKGTAKQWHITVPEWRPDVTIPEDIVDEVGRMIGYEKLPKQAVAKDQAIKDLPPAIRFKEEVKNILVDMGFTEVISHAFYSEQDAGKVKGMHFEIANPLDKTQHLLRESLLPQIENILRQQSNAGKDTAIFEVGLVFNPDRPGSIEHQQTWKLAMGIAHKGAETLKQTITLFQQQLKNQVDPKSQSVESEFVRGRRIETCEFDLKDLRLASKVVFGPWDPKRHITQNVTVREQSKFPAITRDISFWWSGTVADIDTAIKQLNLPLLQDHKLQDTFTRDGQTSYAYTFMYQSPDRTLTKEEVDKLEQKIKDALEKLGATIR